MHWGFNTKYFKEFALDLMGKDKLKGEISMFNGGDVGVEGGGGRFGGVRGESIQNALCALLKKIVFFFFLKKEFALQTLEVFCPLGSESLQPRARRLLACCF